MENNQWFYISIYACSSEKVKDRNEAISIIRDKLAETLYELKNQKIISNFYFNIQWSDENNKGHINVGIRQNKSEIQKEVSKIIVQLKSEGIINEVKNIEIDTDGDIIAELKAIATHTTLINKEDIPVIAKLGFLSHYIRNISGFGINEESFKEEANKLIYLEQNKSKLYKIMEGYINELSNGINESQASGILDIIEINKNLKNPSQ